MRILLINTTRFGDTLQMQPLIHVLRNQGHELAYVCLESFVEVAQLLDGLDHAFPIPGSYLLRNLSEKDGKEWYKSLQGVEDFAKTIHRHFDPQKIINLIPTPLARLLALRIQIQSQKKEANNSHTVEIVGFTLHEKGYKNNTNAWASYMEAVTRNRVSSPYNLSDLFTLLASESLLSQGAQNPRILPLDTKILEEGKALCRNLLLVGDKREHDLVHNIPQQSLKIESKDNEKVVPARQYIAFQLGASDAKRQWDVEHFVALSHILVEKGYIPILVGSAKEDALADKFFSLGGIAKNALGKTSIHLLAGLMSHCSLLITNDTGTMHLAAALEIPIIALFLATAQAWDTGAVSTDACFIEPNLDCHPCDFKIECPHNYKCRKAIPAHIVGELAIKRLSAGKWQQAFSEHTRIWKSIRDELGFLSLEALDILDKNPRYALYQMQRIVYKAIIDALQIAEGIDLRHIVKLDKNEKTSDNSYRSQVGLVVNRKLDVERVLNFYKPDFSLIQLEYINYEEKEHLQEVLSRLMEFFFLLSQQGKLIRQMPKMSQSFLLTNERIIASLKSIPYLVPLSYMWEYGMEKYGDDLDNFDTFARVIQVIIEAWLKELEANKAKMI